MSTIIRYLSPTHVILQAGWHPQGDFERQHVWEKLALTGEQVKSTTGSEVFWRTTAHDQREPLYDYTH
eukprot:7963872-Pyramimonas_sp.AAC.1